MPPRLCGGGQGDGHDLRCGQPGKRDGGGAGIAFASRFTHASTTAIGVAKNVLNQSFNQDHRTLLEMEAAGQSICRDTEFHKEAVRRFADKETPLYNWESFK